MSDSKPLATQSWNAQYPVETAFGSL